MSAFRTVLLFIAASLLSIGVIPLLRVDLIPRETASRITVNYTQPNTSPELIEQQVTAPLENFFSSLTGLTSISSISSYDKGSVTLEFDKQADMDIKKFEVTSLLRQVYSQLPLGVNYPEISQTGNNSTSSHSPFLVYTIEGPQVAWQVRKQAEEVFKKGLSSLQGIEEVGFSGTGEIQLSIEFDQEKLQAYHITLFEIQNTLEEQFRTYYPGIWETDNGSQLFMKVRPETVNLHTIENLLLKTDSEIMLRLKDVAKIYLEGQEAEWYFRINGKNAVNMVIYARSGENILLLAERCREVVQAELKELPSGYRVRLDYDNTEYIQKELHKIYWQSGLSVLILVTFIFLSYRSGRFLLVLFAGLIVNLALVILLAWIFNVNIHLYTLAGITISLGLMIDNAIVMVDYVHRQKSRKVFLSLLGATLTTIAALLLVFLLPEEDRKNLVDFVIIVCIALGTSLLVALSFTPGLHQLLFRQKEEEEIASYFSVKVARSSTYWLGVYMRIISFLVRFRKAFIVLLVLGFGLPVFLLPKEWEGQEWYNKSIGSEFYQETLRPSVDKWTGGALRLFVRNVYEHSGYRDPEKTRLYVDAELPYGNTLQQMNDILIGMEKYLVKVKGVDKFVTQVYSGQYGRIEIPFEEGYEHSALPFQLKIKLIAHSLNWSGAKWNIYGVGRGFQTSSSESIPSFRVMIKGYNFDELEEQVETLAAKLLAHERIQKVNTNESLQYDEKPGQEYVLAIDSRQMALAGATLDEVIGQIKNLSKSIAPATYITMNSTFYPVIFKESSAEDFSNYRMMQSPLPIDTAHLVKIKDFSELKLQHTISAIHKEDRQYIRVVGFEYLGSANFGNEYLDKMLKEMETIMPVGFTAEKLDYRLDWDKEKRQYSLIFVLIAANFFICSILFESLKQPFLIIVMIPVSFIGVFLAFGLLGLYFDQGGYAAFVMLGGLVVNAAIFIINDFNNRRFPSRNYNRELIKVTWKRARTILLTVISTCCGLIPFLVQGQNEVFWFALAAGTTGGLIFSLFAVFIVLPVFMWRK